MGKTAQQGPGRGMEEVRSIGWDRSMGRTGAWGGQPGRGLGGTVAWKRAGVWEWAISWEGEDTWRAQEYGREHDYVLGGTLGHWKGQLNILSLPGYCL